MQYLAFGFFYSGKVYFVAEARCILCLKSNKEKKSLIAQKTCNSSMMCTVVTTSIIAYWLLIRAIILRNNR